MQSFRLKATSEDTMEFVDNTFCFCVHPSPCPCLPCCGCGPLAQKPRFKRDASDPGKWNGTGESLFAGDCCAGMFHNKGDVITWNDEFDGSTKEKAAKFNSGSSPAYPPCLQNTHFGSAYFKPAGGAAPAGDEMER